MATSTSISTALTDVPATLKPYITDKGGVLPTAQTLLSKDYKETYGDPLKAAGLAGSGRVAGMSPMQEKIGAELNTMKTPGEYAQGTAATTTGLGLLNQANTAYKNIADVKAPTLKDYQMQAAPNVSAQELEMYQMAGPESYTGENVSQYMSPYMQQVLEVQKQEALRDFQRGLTAQNLGAARQGTFGGAKNLLANTELQRNLQTQMGGIQAAGLQSAFQNAQQQFNTSQTQQQAANQANLLAKLGVQQLGSGQDLQAQLANQANAQAANQANLQARLGIQQLGAGQSLEAQRANQAADLAAAQGFGNLGQTYGTLGQGFGALATAKQASDIDRLKTQGAYGDLQRATQQQQLDAQYQDLMSKLNYPLTSLETMNNLVRGVPLTQTAASQKTTAPPPSFASQLAGTGLTGLSLYNMFNK
jgi:hypothetical protein